MFGDPYPIEEVNAWNRALNVFDRLPLQTESFYTRYSAWRSRDPVGFNRAIFNAAVCKASKGKNCQ